MWRRATVIMGVIEKILIGCTTASTPEFCKEKWWVSKGHFTLLLWHHTETAGTCLVSFPCSQGCSSKGQNPSNSKELLNCLGSSLVLWHVAHTIRELFSWRWAFEIIWSNSLLKQDHLEEVAQDVVQSDFEYPQGWTLRSLIEQHSPVCDHLQTKKVFMYSDSISYFGISCCCLLFCQWTKKSQKTLAPPSSFLPFSYTQ